MKIAIVSDTHDNLPNFKRAIAWLKKEKIKTLLHCGDICHGETLKECLKDFSGKVHIVFGNADKTETFASLQAGKSLPDVRVWNDAGKITLGKKKIAFCHSPVIGRSLASLQKYEMVFYGHTHKPWEERIGKTRLVNPGNAAGTFYKATFAVYNTKDDKLELKILEKL